MKKFITLINIAFAISLLSSSFGFAQQGLLKEISLQEQVTASTQIVEGKVISRKSYWDINHKNIYTINTVEVYKVFKGQSLTIIEVVTPGGNVGSEFLTVNPSLNLRKGDIGVFTLITDSISLDSTETENPQFFKPYSSKQGFYLYDIHDNIVTNPFVKYEGITSNFYTTLESLTKRNFSDVKKINIDEEAIKLKKNNSNRLLLATITNFSPTTSTAGTESVLTITGTGFGVNQGPTGKVEFRNSNNGGASWVAAYDSQIISWSDTEIQVQIPSGAGTGTIRVDPDLDASVESATTLTISYAQINAVTVNEPITAFRTHHTNRNTTGGMTWQMQTDFDANTPAKDSFMRALNSWICETNINWEMGSVTTVDVRDREGINIIRFDNGAELSAGVLGVAYSYFSSCSNTVYIAEIDLVFDDGTDWEFGPTNAISPKIDFETVSVHELGHAHQLAHVIDPGSAIMHYSVGAGVTNRILSANDIAGGIDVQSRSTTIVPNCTFDGAMTNIACPTASIADELLNESITLYPNPAKGKITIQNNQYISLEKATIYDVSGRLIITKDISKPENLFLNIDQLSQGIYFINIQSNNASATKKFIVK